MTGSESQNVTDYPNSNTIFMVWKLVDIQAERGFSTIVCIGAQS
jgi:putative iron-dependent peroxidase